MCASSHDNYINYITKTMLITLENNIELIVSLSRCLFPAVYQRMNSSWPAEQTQQALQQNKLSEQSYKSMFNSRSAFLLHRPVSVHASVGRKLQSDPDVDPNPSFRGRVCSVNITKSLTPRVQLQLQGSVVCCTRPSTKK